MPKKYAKYAKACNIAFVTGLVVIVALQLGQAVMRDLAHANQGKPAD